MPGYGVHFGFGFADGQAADGVAVKGYAGDEAGGFGPQFGDDAALDDAEQGLAAGAGAAGVGVVAGLGPAVGAGHSVFDGGGLAGGEDALVEAHYDVGADVVLVMDGGFRGEEVAAAVDVGLESDAGVADAAEGTHAECLVAAAVGKDGAVPAHKAMEAAGVADAVHAGAEVEVVGVAEDGFGAEAAHFGESEALDGGLGGDGHKQGRLRCAVGRDNLPAPGRAVGSE